MAKEDELNAAKISGDLSNSVGNDELATFGTGVGLPAPKEDEVKLATFDANSGAPYSGYRAFAPNVGDEDGIARFNVEEYSPYITNVMDVESLDYQRAKNQSTGEQLGKTVGNLIPNVALGIIETVGYFGALFTEFGENRDYTNAITQFAQKHTNPLGESFRENPNEVFDLGDPAWWINHGGSLVESIGEFAVTGYGVGLILGKGAGAVAKALANSTRMAKHANTLLKASQLTSQVGTSFSLSYLEGAMSGGQVYKDAVANGSTKEEAAEAAARTVHFNTAIVGLLNMTSVAPLFQNHTATNYAKKIGLEKLKGKKLTLDQLDKFTPNMSREAIGKVLGREALQEGIEEDVNLVAEYLGRSKAGLEKDGESELQGSIDAVFSEEGALNFILGAVGGIGQTGALKYAPIKKKFDQDGQADGFESAADQESRVEQEKASKYIGDLRSDLQQLVTLQDDLKRSTAKFHLAEGDEAKREAQDEINGFKNEMFAMNAYRSILNGTGDFLAGTFNEIAAKDNTKLLTDGIDEQLKEVNGRTAQNEDEQIAKEEEIQALQEQRANLSGRTAAMIAGLTDHIETAEDIANPNYYKNIAKKRAADLNTLKNDHEQIYAKFSFNQDEELAGIPDYIFQKHAMNYLNESNISDYEAEVNTMESQIREAQTKAGVDVTAIDFAMKQAQVDGIKKAKTKLKRKHTAAKKKLATQAGRDLVRKQIGFTGKRMTVKALNKYYDALYKVQEDQSTQFKEELTTTRKSFKGDDASFNQQLIINQIQQEELADRKGVIAEARIRLTKENATLEELKTPKARKELIALWKETQKNVQQAVAENRKKELSEAVKDGKMNEDELRSKFDDIEDVEFELILGKTQAKKKQEKAKEVVKEEKETPKSEVSPKVVKGKEAEVATPPKAETTTKAPKLTNVEKLTSIRAELLGLRAKRTEVESNLEQLDKFEISGQPIGTLYDNGLPQVELAAKEEMLSKDLEPDSPANTDELLATTETFQKLYDDNFNEQLEDYTVNRKLYQEQLTDLTDQIKVLNGKVEVFVEMLEDVEAITPVENVEKPSNQEQAKETMVTKELEVIDGMTYIYMPNMTNMLPDIADNYFVPDNVAKRILRIVEQDLHEGSQVSIQFEESEDLPVDNRPISIKYTPFGEGAVILGYLQQRDQVHAIVPPDLLSGKENNGIRYGQDASTYWTTTLADNIEILNQATDSGTLLEHLKAFKANKLLSSSPEFKALKTTLSPYYNTNRTEDEAITHDIAVDYALHHIGNVVFFGENYDDDVVFNPETIKKNLSNWGAKIFSDLKGAKNIQERLLAKDGPITTTVGKMSSGNPFYTDINSNLVDILGGKAEYITLMKTDPKRIGERSFQDLSTGEVVHQMDSDRDHGYTGQIYTAIRGLNGSMIPIPLHTGTIGEASDDVQRIMRDQVEVLLLEAANALATDVGFPDAIVGLAKRTLMRSGVNYDNTAEDKQVWFESKLNNKKVRVRIRANQVNNLQLSIETDGKNKVTSQAENPKAFKAELQRAINGMQRNIPIGEDTGSFEGIERLDHEGNELTVEQYHKYLINTNALTTDLGRIELDQGGHTNITPNTGRRGDQKVPFTLHLNNPAETTVKVAAKKELTKTEQVLGDVLRSPAITTLLDSIQGGSFEVEYSPDDKLFTKEPTGIAFHNEDNGNLLVGDKFAAMPLERKISFLAHELVHTFIQRTGRHTPAYAKMDRLLKQFIKKNVTTEFIDTLEGETKDVFIRLKPIVEKDSEEMLTYALTDPNVIAVLANVQANGMTRKTYWDMLKKYINDILKEFGYTDNNLLQEISNIMDAFVTDDFTNYAEQLKPEVKDEVEEDELTKRLREFGDDSGSTNVKLAVALSEKQGALDNVVIPERSTDTKPYHMSIFDNTAQELHSFNIVRNILLSTLDNLKDVSLGEAFRDPSKSVKNIVINNVRDEAINLHKAKAITAKQVEFTLNMLQELSLQDSELWSRTKNYIFRVDGIRITDAQEKLDGVTLTAEEINKVRGHWDDTAQFKLPLGESVSTSIKALFNTTLKLDPTTQAFNQNADIDIVDYVSAHVERTTPSGFAEAISWDGYSNFMINVMSGAVDVQDMLDRLYTVASYHTTLLPLYHKVANNESLRKEWYRNFKNQSPVANQGLWNKSGAETYSMRILAGNRDSFIEFGIADGYQQKVLAKLKEGSYKFNEEYNSDKLYVDKLVSVTPENLKSVAAKISNVFNTLGFKVDPIAVEYEVKRQPEANWTTHFRTTFATRMTAMDRTIKAQIKEIKLDPKASISYRNLGDGLELAKTMRLFTIEVGDASYTDVNGNLVYTHQKTSFYTDWFDSLKNPKKAEQLLQQYAACPKNQHSNWLWNTSKDPKNPNGFANYTVQENGTKVFESPNTLFIENSRHGLHAGHKNTSLNKASEYKQMTANDWAMQELAYFLTPVKGINNKVEYINKSVADAGHTVTYTGVKIPISPTEMAAAGTAEFRKSEMHKALYNVFLQEYNETLMATAAKSQGGLELFELDENLNVATDDNGSPVPSETLDYSKLQLNKDYINSYKTKGGKFKDGNFVVYPEDAQAGLEGTPTGNIFKFLNLEINDDNGQTYLHDYVRNVIHQDDLGKEYTLDLVSNGVIAKHLTPELVEAVNEFIDKYIDSFIETEFERFADIESQFNKIYDNKNQKLLAGHGTSTGISPFKHAVSEFALNSLIKNVEEGEFWGGDTREYKGAIDANKRYGQTIKTGHVSANDGTFTGITITDRLLDSPIIDQIEKATSPEMAKAYERLNTGDAQSYITWNEFKKRLENFGETANYKSLIDAIDGFAPFDPHAHAAKLQSLKYFLYDRQFDKSLNRMRSDQLKNSIHILIPRFIVGTQLETLEDMMRSQGIDQVNFESAVKVGTKSVVKLHNNDGSLKDMSELIAVVKDAKQNYRHSALRIQQDVSDHVFETENKLGIQIAKVIFNNLSATGNYTLELPDGTSETMTGKDLRDQFFDIYTQNIYGSLVKLSDSLGKDITPQANFNPEAYGAVTFDGETLRSTLEQYLLESGADNNILYAITRDEVYDDALKAMGITDVPATQIPIFATAYVDKIISVLGSKFTNQIINQKFPGSHCAIVSDAFFQKNSDNDQLLAYSGNPLKYTDEFQAKIDSGKRTSRLRCETYTANGKNITKAEVVMTPWMKDFYVEGELIDINKLPAIVRTQLGYRIPTEDKHSMVVFEVVGFLQTGASAIILPDELVSRSGLDFDIDSQYMMQYNLTNSKGEWRVVPYLAKDAKENFNKYLKTVSSELKELNSDFFAGMQGVIANRNEIITETNAELYESTKGKVITKDTYPKLIKSMDDQLQPLREKLAEFNQDGTSDSNRVKWIKERTGGVFETIEAAVTALANRIVSLEIEQLAANDSKMEVNDAFIEAKDMIENLEEQYATIKAQIVEKYKPEFEALTREQQNPLAARQNRMLSMMISVLQNPKHYEELVSPSETEHVYSAQDAVEKFSNAAKRDLNFNRPSDLAHLRELNLNVRELKGIAVGFSGLMSVFQTANIKLAASSGITIRHDKLDSKQMKWYRDNYGKDVKTLDGGSIEVTYRSFMKTSSGGLNNVHNEKISNQVSEVAPAVLDAVKKPMSANMGSKTLTPYMLFSAVGVTHIVDGKPNSHAYANALIEQPVVKTLIKEQKNREGLLYEGRSVGQAINDIRKDMYIEIYDASIKTLLVNDQERNIHGALKDWLANDLITDRSATFSKAIFEMRKLQPNNILEIDNYENSLRSAQREITKRFEGNAKHIKAEDIKKFVRKLAAYALEGSTRPIDYAFTNIGNEVFKAKAKALSYEDLLNNIKYAEQKKGEVASLDLKHSQGQLVMLNKWAEYDAIANTITTATKSFNTDKLSAGPEIEVLEEHEESLDKLTANKHFVREQLKGRKVDPEVVKKLEFAIDNKNYGDVLKYSARLKVSPTRLIIGDMPATMAVYPSHYGSTEQSAYKPLDSYLKYGQKVAHAVLGKISFAHQFEVKEGRETALAWLGIEADKAAIKAFNKFTMGYPVRHLPLVSNLYRNDKLEYKMLLGLAENQTTLKSIGDAEVTDALFEQLSVSEQISYATRPDSEFAKEIADYGGSHVLSLVTILNDAKPVKNNGFEKLLFNTKGKDINIISDSVQSMWNSSEPKSQMLAESLVQYAFVVDGLGFTFKGAGKLIPAQVLVNTGYTEMLRTFQSNPSLVMEEVVQDRESFVKSNWRNESLVPRIYIKDAKKINKYGLIKVDAYSLPQSAEHSEYVAMENKVLDSDTKRQIVETTLFKRYREQGLDPLTDINDDLRVEGDVIYYPIPKLMPNEAGNTSVLDRNNVEVDETLMRLAADQFVMKQLNFDPDLDPDDNKPKRITKDDAEIEKGINLVTGDASILANLEDVVSKTDGTLNMEFNEQFNSRAYDMSTERTNVILDGSQFGAEAFDTLNNFLDRAETPYITGANIGQMLAINPAYTQDALDGHFSELINAIATGRDLTSTTVYITGESGVEEAMAKAFAKHEANVVVQAPKGGYYHNTDGQLAQHKNQTTRFKLAIDLEEDPLARAFGELGEEDNVSAKEKAQARVEFIANAIADSKTIEKMFSKVADSDAAKAARKTSKEFESISFSALKANDLQVQSEALEIKIRNSEVTLDFVTQVLALNENQKFKLMIHNKKQRDKYNYIMDYARTFLATFDQIDVLEPLVGDELSEIETKLNEQIETLKKFAGDAIALKRAHGRIHDRFIEAVIEDTTYDEYLKEDAKRVWESRDDLGRTQFLLDSVAETGDSLIDNYMKVFQINEHKKTVETNESTAEFNVELTKWFGDVYSKSFGSQSIKESTRKKLATKFFETFVNAEHGHLITKFDYLKHRNDKGVLFKAYLDAKSRYGVEANETRTARVRLNQWVTKNTTNEQFYKGDRVSTLVNQARDGKSQAQFDHYVKSKNFALIAGAWVYQHPSSVYIDPRYTAMYNEDGTPSNKDGEFHKYLVDKVESTLNFDGAPSVIEGFLPNLADKDRSNLYSLGGYLGMNSTVQDTSEIQGIGDEEIFILNMPFIAEVMNQEAQPQLKFDKGIAPDVELARLNELGHTFKTFEEVEVYNAEIKAKNALYKVENKEFDILRVMDAFISGATNHKYKTAIQHEMLLFQDRIKTLELNVKSRSGFKEKYSLGKLTGKKEFATTTGDGSRLQNRVKHMMKVYFAGIKEPDSNFDKAIKAAIVFTSSKSMFLNFTSGLGNVTKGRSDLLIEAGAEQFIEAKHLRDADKAYFTRAMSDAYANGSTEKSDTKEGAFIKKLDIVSLPDEKGTMLDSKIKNAMDGALLKMDSLYVFMNVTEHYMQNVMLLAMSKSHRIMDGKIMSRDQYIGDVREELLLSILNNEQTGEYNNFKNQYSKKVQDKKEKFDRFKFANELIPDFVATSKTLDKATRKKVADAIVAEHKVRTTDFETLPSLFESMNFEDGLLNSEISETELAHFKIKVKSVNHTMHGIYNQFDKSVLQNYVLGQAALQFRKWMRPNWNRYYGPKFGRSQFSEGTQTEKKGAYTSWGQFIMRPSKGHSILKPSKEDETSWKAVRNLMNDYGKFVSQARVHYNLLSHVDKANVKRVNHQMLMIATMATLLTGLGALEDDDKPIDNYSYALAIFQLNRLYTELIEFAPVYGWLSQANRTLQYPAASEKSMLDLAKFVQNMFMYPFRSDEERVFQNGRKYDRDKVWDSTIKNTPILNQIDKMANIEDYVSYYKMFRLF